VLLRAFLLLAAIPTTTPTPTPLPFAPEASRSVERAVTAKSAEEQQSAFDALLQLGCPAVPALAQYLSDARHLSFHSLRLRNEARDAFEAYRLYGPETVGDAIAAILNAVTGQHFGFVYNGSTESERAECARRWRAFIASTPRSELCGPAAPKPTVPPKGTARSGA
jgi:hypothetical protein